MGTFTPIGSFAPYIFASSSHKELFLQQSFCLEPWFTAYYLKMLKTCGFAVGVVVFQGLVFHKTGLRMWKHYHHHKIRQPYRWTVATGTQPCSWHWAPEPTHSSCNPMWQPADQVCISVPRLSSSTPYVFVITFPHTPLAPGGFILRRLKAHCGTVFLHKTWCQPSTGAPIEQRTTHRL